MNSEDELLVRKIVSGGQTGVDRGALEAAIALGIDHGGWCPRGRRAEDGVIPARFQQSETDSANYHVRTEQNVIDSDATLIITRGRLRGGTALTLRMAEKHARPYYVVDLDKEIHIEAIRAWLRAQQASRLNVAGPRETSAPGISQQARCLVESVLGTRAQDSRR